MPKLIYQGGLFAGVVLDGGKPVCEVCKDKECQATFITHVDFTDRFTNVFKCDCGNEISVTRKRKGKFM